MSFSFTGTDNVGGSGVASFTCRLDGSLVDTACTSPKSYTGLSTGSHTFEVWAIDNAGNADPTPASYTWMVDADAPTTLITLDPTNPSGGAGWYVPWVKLIVNASDSGGSGLAETRCDVVPQGSPPLTFAMMTGCAYLFPGQFFLPDGKWTIYAASSDNVGNISPVESRDFKIDKTPPVPTTNAPTTSASTSFLVSWSATDQTGLSGVKNQDVRYRQKFGSSYGAYTTWKSAVATPGSATFTGARFNTYCFSSRARDNALNTSAWSTEKCTTIT